MGTTHDLGAAAGVLRLGNAFCDSQALLTALDFDLFTVLHENPSTQEEIRQRVGLHGRGLRDFLRLLVALELLKQDGDRFHNTEPANRFLVGTQESYVGGFLKAARISMYVVWGGLAETLRTGDPRKPPGSFQAILDNPQLLTWYVNMMDGLTQPLAPKVIDAFDWSGYATVLDVGGLRGNLAGQLVKAQPELEVGVFDLPQLRTPFDEYLAEVGLTGRVQFHSGDFFTDALPSADVLILGHILPEWPREQGEQIVRAAYEAVEPGGALLIYDRILDDHVNNVEKLVASISTVMVTEGGSHYIVGELTELAQTAGFGSVSHQDLDESYTLVCCRKN